MLFYTPAFLFVFLPVALAGYFLLGKKQPELARLWLLGASLIFYTLGTSANLALLLTSIGCNYFLARGIAAEKIGSGFRKWLLGAGISLNIGVLAYYKCLGMFSLHDAKTGYGYFLDILIPLGLSFFTLQQIAFLVDTYRNRIRETSLLRYALFISFFPQLIAGPIVRYQEMMPQFDRKQTFRFRYEHLAMGSSIFILGVLKKLCIADNLAPVVNAVFTSSAQGQSIMMVDAWLGSLSFYLQLYFDFSAYSDMAIGVARMFGITLPINFNSPYQSSSLPQVFLRWHITFYRFLTDYLLIPMIAFVKKIPLGSHVLRTRIAVSLATVTIFGISGLWHGVAMNFVLWGLLNGLAITLIYLGKELRILPRKGRAGKNFKGHAATFFFCLFALVVFRCQSLAQVGAMFKAMAGFNGISLPQSLEPVLGNLKILGITFQGVLRYPELLAWSGEKYLFLALFLASFGIVFWGANIYELTARYTPALGFNGSGAESRLPGWIQMPSRGFAVAMALGAALVVSLVVDSGSSGSAAFIYFHF